MAEKYTASKKYLCSAILFCASFSSPSLFADEETDIILDIQRLNLDFVAEARAHSPSIAYSYNYENGLSLKSKRQYPFGLVRFKPHKTLRVRGWEIRDNIYFGQTKVGKKWGVGLVLDRGTHYYGLNNRGISFLKKF